MDGGNSLSWLSGSSEVGALVRTKVWSDTALGPVECWPQSLKTSVSIVLDSRFPMSLLWGSELIQIYNDGYGTILGPNRHPRYLGCRAKECWPEIWPVIEPMFNCVLRDGKSTWNEDFLLVMTRHNYVEETYFTFSYSPVREENGGIGGVLVVCTETT